MYFVGLNAAHHYHPTRRSSDLITALGFVENRDVWLDPAFTNQPPEHLGRAIGAVRGHSFGIETELILDPIDHRARRADLRLPDRAARLDIDNDTVVEIDQVIDGVSEEGVPFECAGPLCGRI